MATFLEHVFGTILGILGLLLTGYSLVAMLWGLLRHNRGQALPGYHQQWTSWPPSSPHGDQVSGLGQTPPTSSLTPLHGLLIMGVLGLFVGALAITGEWIRLLTDLILIAHRWAQAITIHGK